MTDPVEIVLTIAGVLIIVALVAGVALLLKSDAGSADDGAVNDAARAEKQRLRDEKAAERHRQRQAEQQARAAKLADDRKRAGPRIHSANFGGKMVEIYANGYVRVAMFMRDSVPFQKLLSIQVESNVQKKTGPALYALKRLYSSGFFAFLQLAGRETQVAVKRWPRRSIEVTMPGTIFFDVVGPVPNSVVYNDDGLQDLLTWIPGPPLGGERP